MVLTFVLSQCFIVKLLTKPILLRSLFLSNYFSKRCSYTRSQCSRLKSAIGHFRYIKTQLDREVLEDTNKRN